MARKLAFYVLLALQWLLLLPLTLYASERFSDAYDYIEDQQDPVLILPADPDAGIHFGIYLCLLIGLTLVLLYLSPRQGSSGKLATCSAALPVLLSIAVRLWGGCMTCMP